VKLSKQLRMSATTASAAVTGFVNLLSGRGERHPLELSRATWRPTSTWPAPMPLVQSRDYRSHDVVVLAWFPKAFTAAARASVRRSGRATGTAWLKARFWRERGHGRHEPAVCRVVRPRLPHPLRPDKAVARPTACFEPLDHRSLDVYIGKDGRILDIDRHVRPLSHRTRTWPKTAA